ncbi:hypothetical protein ACNOYE_05860 [Nannocystaceae bacterium ST9]
MHRRAVSLSLPRFARGLVLAALVLAVPAGCDKSGGTSDPGGGTDKPSKAGGIEFAYAESFAIDGQVSVEIESDSPEGKGAAKIVAKTRLDAAPAAGKTKIHAKVLELVEFNGSGSLDPEFIKQQMVTAGTADFDLLATLKTAEEWSIVDARGETDDDATKALAENANPKPMGGDQFGLFVLPDLPSVPLEIGKQVKLPTESEEQDMFGQPVPTESDVTWTLVSIGDVGGRKVAKLEVLLETSGAAELQGGQAMLSIASEASFTIEFDVDAKLPISLTGESTQELAFESAGQSGSVQNTTKFAATYTPAGV